MQLSISKILSNISTTADLNARRQALWDMQNNTALMTILKLGFEPTIRFYLPESTPPYTPCPYLDQQAMLYTATKKLSIFVEHTNIHPYKLQTMFIKLLESLDPEDAKLMIAVKDKNITSLYPNINLELLNTVFPGFITEVPKESVVKPLEVMEDVIPVVKPQTKAKPTRNTKPTRKTGKTK